MVISRKEMVCRFKEMKYLKEYENVLQETSKVVVAFVELSQKLQNFLK